MEGKEEEEEEDEESEFEEGGKRWKGKATRKREKALWRFGWRFKLTNIFGFLLHHRPQPLTATTKTITDSLSQ